MILLIYTYMGKSAIIRLGGENMKTYIKETLKTGNVDKPKFIGVIKIYQSGVQLKVFFSKIERITREEALNDATLMENEWSEVV